MSTHIEMNKVRNKFKWKFLRRNPEYRNGYVQSQKGIFTKEMDSILLKYEINCFLNPDKRYEEYNYKVGNEKSAMLNLAQGSKITYESDGEKKVSKKTYQSNFVNDAYNYINKPVFHLAVRHIDKRKLLGSFVHMIDGKIFSKIGVPLGILKRLETAQLFLIDISHDKTEIINEMNHILEHVQKDYRNKYGQSKPHYKLYEQYLRIYEMKEKDKLKNIVIACNIFPDEYKKNKDSAERAVSRILKKVSKLIKSGGTDIM